MRLGVGGGGRILRGGVSVGRGGVRGGVGVGPFHLSGGSRKSRTSIGDDLAEELGPYVLAAIAVFFVLTAVVLLVAGPLLYLFFALSLISLLSAVITVWQLSYGRRHSRAIGVVLFVLAHVGTFGFMQLQRWINEYEVRNIQGNLASGDSDPFFVFEFADLRYWTWWSRQSNTLTQVLWRLDIYFLLPSLVILTAICVVRDLRARKSPLDPMKLSVVQTRMKKFEEIAKRNQFELDLSNLTKSERKKVMTWMQSSVAELREFWRSQLDLPTSAVVSPSLTKKYSRRFDVEIRKFMELERQDGFVLERDMSHQKIQAIFDLSAHRLAEVALLLEQKRISNRQVNADVGTS